MRRHVLATADKGEVTSLVKCSMQWGLFSFGGGWEGIIGKQGGRTRLESREKRHCIRSVKLWCSR